MKHKNLVRKKKYSIIQSEAYFKSFDKANSDKKGRKFLSLLLRMFTCVTIYFPARTKSIGCMSCGLTDNEGGVCVTLNIDREPYRYGTSIRVCCQIIVRNPDKQSYSYVEN